MYRDLYRYSVERSGSTDRPGRSARQLRPREMYRSISVRAPPPPAPSADQPAENAQLGCQAEPNWSPRCLKRPSVLLLPPLLPSKPRIPFIAAPTSRICFSSLAQHHREPRADTYRLNPAPRERIYRARARDRRFRTAIAAAASLPRDGGLPEVTAARDASSRTRISRVRFRIASDFRLGASRPPCKRRRLRQSCKYGGAALIKYRG